MFQMGGIVPYTRKSIPVAVETRVRGTGGRMRIEARHINVLQTTKSTGRAMSFGLAGGGEGHATNISEPTTETVWPAK